MKHVLRKKGSLGAGSDTVEDAGISECENEGDGDFEDELEDDGKDKEEEQDNPGADSHAHAQGASVSSRLTSAAGLLDYGHEGGIQGMVRSMQLQYQQAGYPAVMMAVSLFSSCTAFEPLAASILVLV